MARERTPPRARIVCVTTEHPHRHIVSVGIGGEPVAPFTTLVVAEVRAALAAGTAFYTLSSSTEKKHRSGLILAPLRAAMWRQSDRYRTPSPTTISTTCRPAPWPRRPDGQPYPLT